MAVILRIVKTMLSDRNVCVRRLREGYEFFRSMSERQGVGWPRVLPHASGGITCQQYPPLEI